MNKSFLFNSRKAFTLVELLSVIGIFSLLAVVLTPAVSSLSGSGGVVGAVTEVSSQLELARQRAMQMGTWVWVGIEDTSGISGEGELSVVSVASKDGTVDSSPSNLVPIARPARIHKVKALTQVQDTVTVLGAVPGDFKFSWKLPGSTGQQDVEFSRMVLGFSPRGEAVITGTEVPDWIKVDLVSSSNAGNIVSVLISGPTGQVVVSK